MGKHTFFFPSFRSLLQCKADEYQAKWGYLMVLSKKKKNQYSNNAKTDYFFYISMHF